MTAFDLAIPGKEQSPDFVAELQQARQYIMQTYITPLKNRAQQILQFGGDGIVVDDADKKNTGGEKGAYGRIEGGDRTGVVQGEGSGGGGGGGAYSGKGTFNPSSIPATNTTAPGLGTIQQ